MAVTAALIAGGATLASAGIGAASTLAANGRGAQDNRSLQLAQLQDARNNEAYIQALNAMLIQQGRAGYVDSEGNSLTYDPTTNTYTSKLGQQPADARRAALEAQIQRDTTDQAQARRVNAAAESRSLRAATSAEPFLNQINNYRPISGTQLGDILQERGAIATNDAYRPLIQQALTQAGRTGSASGPIIADIGRQSAADLRKNALDSMIAGQTGAADINSKNLGTLASAYTTLNANANPTLQFPSIATDDANKTMANLAAQRAALSVNALQGAGQNATGATKVAGDASGAVPVADTNDLSRTLKGLGDIFSPDRINSLAKNASTIFGSDTPAVNTTFGGFAPVLKPGDTTAGGFTAR